MSLTSFASSDCEVTFLPERSGGYGSYCVNFSLNDESYRRCGEANWLPVAIDGYCHETEGKPTPLECKLEMNDGGQYLLTRGGEVFSGLHKEQSDILNLSFDRNDLIAAGACLEEKENDTCAVEKQGEGKFIIIRGGKPFSAPYSTEAEANEKITELKELPDLHNTNPALEIVICK